ncbi:SET domain-containing protein-lysine N-methyltransferase [Nannocystis sp.]|uniref:SET domain-containing protein-lysine N-methyltransferase n=1 Tax=Nannocystis sp. TaxID=1962667 RepID=UPI00344D804D
MDARIAPLPRARTWSSPKIELRPGAEGLGVFAVEAISAGEVLMAIAEVFVEQRAQHTIQIDEHRHQAGTGEIDDYLNHSCDPNCALVFDRLELVALRPLVAGEELSFNYLSSEWDMAAPFRCGCGAAGCMRSISGFRWLAPAEQDALAPLASPYLRQRLAAERTKA